MKYKNEYLLLQIFDKSLNKYTSERFTTIEIKEQDILQIKNQLFIKDSYHYLSIDFV
jgi:hypothetical protein